MEYNKEIKVILVGDSGVGKTNLINTSIGLEFNKNNDSTISSSFNTKQLKIYNKKYNVHLWDTAGQEKYRNVAKLFFEGAKIAILVYDITDQKTFISLEDWYNICEETINQDIGAIYGVIGNKIDLYMENEVDEGEAKEFSKKINADFKLVSAKEDPKLFVEFIEELVGKYAEKENQQEENSFSIKYKSHKKIQKKECC